jgi:alpha-D-ribose 1-methylphosphonate 5-triphosphate diphosphatase
MTERKTCIYNARLVLPDRIVRGHILIGGGRIAEITECDSPVMSVHPDFKVIDAGGCYVMPGMIDMHSDAIEKEIQPRPNTLFPIPMAFYELEKKLAVSGITTIYHSLSLTEEWGVRHKDNVLAMIRSINSLKKIRSMINHKIHLRYELTFLEGANDLEELVRHQEIDFMSYMDHTPGQGQYKDDQAYKKYVMKAHGEEEKNIEAILAKAKRDQAKIDWPKLTGLAQLAKSRGIRLASHDDDKTAKIDTLLSCQGAVSEFPINLETAVYARQQGVHVCVGAPNIIRGKSHENNLRAIDAIQNRAADIVCSDYLPSAMLPAVFNLSREGIELTEAVKMVSLNPARALGIDGEVGSIEVGKYADLIIADFRVDYPLLHKTLVGGTPVYQAGFQTFNKERVDIVC